MDDLLRLLRQLWMSQVWLLLQNHRLAKLRRAHMRTWGVRLRAWRVW